MDEREELQALRRLAELEDKAAKASRPKTPEAKAAEAESSLPAWMQDAMKYGPGFLKQQGKNLARGALELPSNTADLLFSAPDPLLKSPLGTKVNEGGDMVRAEIRKAFPRTENPTPAEALADKTFEAGGAGGAFGALSGIKSGVLPLLRNTYSGFSGAAIGVPGGEASKNLATNAGLGENAGGIAEVLGSILTGGLAGFATGPRQTSAQSDIRRAAEGADFSEAGRNVDKFNAVGSKTATLGEAFPPGSAMRDLVSEARGGNLSNSVKTRTMGRNEDLTELGQKTLSRVGPEVNANSVAERVAQAANAIEKNLDELKNTGFRNRVGGQAILPHKVKALEDALLDAAKAEQRQGPKSAYYELAAALRNTDTKELTTSVPELSKIIYGFQTQMKNGAVLGKSGNSIQANDMNIPLRNFKDTVEAWSPAFAGANKDARAFNRADFPNQGPRAEFAQSPLKKLADRNPALVDPTPASRLNAITQGTSPADIKKTLFALEKDPGIVSEPGRPVGAAEVARALLQQQLENGPTNPGAVLRGAPGSLKDRRLTAVLEAAGKDPNAIKQPLDVADLLQGLPAQAGRNEGPLMQGVQALLRPFRTADMEITGLSVRSTNQQLADYLANPTREGLKTLQKLAMFDPTLRRQLTVIAPLLGAQTSKEN